MCKTAWILFLYLTTSCFVVSDGYFLSLSNGNHTLTRFKRQSSQCRTDEYQCGSGECVSEDVICDGAEDCKDGTDESSCSKFPCHSYLFKCAYGACISADLVCDGTKHCKDNSDETNAKCVGNTNKPSKCGVNKFSCDDGQCIDDFDLCDGKANCKDASDESVKACASLKCPRFTFKCNYGACVNSDLRCNGENDCHDASDEINCPGRPNPVTSKPSTVSPVTDTIWTRNPDVVTPRPGPSPDSCQLPPHPRNGKWTVFGVPGSYSPGDTVDKNTVLNFQCNTQYALYPNNQLILCGSTTTYPECLKTCAPIISSDRMEAVCTLNGVTVDCKTPYQGTQAFIQCKPLYENPSLESKPNRFCDDGSWDFALPQCDPICGLKSTDATPLIINGKATKKGEYPWMIGLYNEAKSHICGGSMITPEITLTAAHCINEVNDPSKYFVAAGKYYRTYNDTRDKIAQYSNVKEIKIHKDYSSEFYSFDIAILLLETPFVISKYVLPVCMDYNERFDDSSLIETPGVVVGWGHTTSTDNPSEVLKELQLTFRTRDTCVLDDDFKKYYIYARDKICAAARMGDSACQGDSGGGLFFKKGGRYFVRGIVSIGALNKRDNGCDAYQSTLFTAVHYHAPFIQNYINEARGKNKRS